MRDKVVGIADDIYDAKPTVAGYDGGSHFVNETKSMGVHKGLVNNKATTANGVSS